MDRAGEFREKVRKATAVLGEAVAMDKCLPCGCFHEAVRSLAGVGQGQDGNDSLERLLEKGKAPLLPRRYDCLGCAVCPPAQALNYLSEAGVPELSGGCPAEAPEKKRGWPPYPGEFRVLRYRAPVAVCTLADLGLMERLAVFRDPSLFHCRNTLDGKPRNRTCGRQCRRQSPYPLPDSLRRGVSGGGGTSGGPVSSGPGGKGTRRTRTNFGGPGEESFPPEPRPGPRRPLPGSGRPARPPGKVRRFGNPGPGAESRREGSGAGRPLSGPSMSGSCPGPGSEADGSRSGGIFRDLRRWRDRKAGGGTLFQRRDLGGNRRREIPLRNHGGRPRPEDDFPSGPCGLPGAGADPGRAGAPGGDALCPGPGPGR